MPRFLFVLVIMCLVGGKAYGQCPLDRQEPKIAIEDVTSPVSYDFSKSAEEIKRIAGIQGANTVEHGLTTVELAKGLKVSFLIYRGPGGVCALPALVTLKLGFSATHVYVQNDYGYGTCQSNAVLLHENTHVSNAWESLRRRMPMITEALRIATAHASGQAMDAETAEHSAILLIEQPVFQEVDLAWSDRARLDAELDSPPSIQGTIQSCSWW